MNTTVQLLGKFEKQPAEILDYDVDYTEWFGDRVDEAESFTSTVPTPLVLVSGQLVGKVVKLVISGGAAGQIHKITVRLTTTLGLVKEADFQIRIREV